MSSYIDKYNSSIISLWEERMWEILSKDERISRLCPMLIPYENTNKPINKHKQSHPARPTSTHTRVSKCVKEQVYHCKEGRQVGTSTRSKYSTHTHTQINKQHNTKQHNMHL